MSDSTHGSEGSLQLARIYLDQGRFREAEGHLKKALSESPQDAGLFYLLALCQLSNHRPSEALPSIGEALRRQPQHAEFHALLSGILCALGRGREALAAAEEALRLNPESTEGFRARCQALCSLSRWPEAEEMVLQVLRLDAENVWAASQLAFIQRSQGRTIENADHLRHMLGRHPDDADTHAAMAWNHLQQGNRAEAEKHFREALRLDPENRAARDGILETLRARSPVYRAYLNFAFTMQRFSAAQRWVIVIGLIVLINVGGTLLQGPAGRILLWAYFLFALWTHAARAVGNGLLLTDSLGRLILTTEEKVEGLIISVLMAVGIITVPVAFLLNSGALMAGMYLVLACFPLAYVFVNEARNGVILFSLFTAAILMAGALDLAHSLGLLSLEKGLPNTLFLSSFILAMITSWACSSRALVRRVQYVA